MTTISATIKIIDGFSSPLTNLASRLTTAGNAMNRLKGRTAQSGNIFKNVLGANLVGTGITKGLSLIGTGMHSMLSELNSSSAAWQTFNGNMSMLGKSQSSITATRGSLQKFAQQTIYSASDMASAYSQFAAVGTKNTLGLVKGMGGLAAAASDPQQAMKTLMQQSVQAAAKPKIQWQDFRLMLEQTPAGMAAVAKTMHESTGQLVKDVQAGKISTQKFFNAIAKTGTNANFTKLATQYKTVGQAADGLRETLANKLQNAFDSTSKVGIRAISSLTDKIGNINFDKMIPGLVSFAKGVVSALTTAGNAVKDFFSGFASSGAIGAIKNTFSSIGNAIGNITSKLNHASGGNLAQTLGSISGAGIAVAANAATMLSNALGRLSPGEILAIVGAFAGFKLIGGIMIAAGAGINAFANATQGLSKGLSFIQSLPAMIAAAFSPVGAIILGITAIIVAAVAAWATDFMGFRSVVSGIASAFAPIVSAAQQMLAALAPLGPALSAIFQTIGIGVIAGAALGFAALADSLITIGSAAMVVVHALGAVVNTLGAVGYAITGNFSKAASAMSAAKDDVSGIGSALSHIGSHNTVDAVISALSKLGSTASDTKAKTSNIKVNATGNVSEALTSLTQLQTQAAKPIRTKIEAPTALPTSNIFSQLQSQASSNPIKAKVQADTSTTGNPLAKLQAQATNTPIKAKVATPKVPTPVMPKGQTMHVNVARPKVPTPIMPKMPTMHVTVARPKVPTPTLPHLGTIPAPHVNRPSLAGVIGAVRSGMTASVSAARSGGAQITSAVRSAVNNAAAAARAGAGAMRSAGAAIGAGLAAGMNSQVGAVEAAASRLAAAADKAARAAAKVHSPSKVFAEIGSYMGQGLAIGMNQTNALVASSGTSLANSAINAAHMKSVLGQGMTINSTLSDQSTPTTSPEQLQTILTSGQSVNRSSQSNNSSTITIAKGAIQINSQGNSQQDLESLVQQFENYLVNRQRNRLGVEGNE
ncbi:tape measure protein [Lentilactobacillus parafarraginis]|uniref:Tape measure protein n=1 Tax=Lentilactobacillus parafarraginis TaxID=390842 RepID=A0A5R9CJ31_9LACO|nr:tape measure protein [Lentilactobacillus parafarraginis]TLQ15298.1 tape measure protein [Lentilactobacillus parafarraginis]